MPQFSTKRRIRHSAADMFALVADVERYPEFVPLCRDLIVRRRSRPGDEVDVHTHHKRTRHNNTNS
jgi:coenzyme Q-binding protein COQ10